MMHASCSVGMLITDYMYVFLLFCVCVCEPHDIREGCLMA
jgi:hypothetical protein